METKRWDARKVLTNLLLGLVVLLAVRPVYGEQNCLSEEWLNANVFRNENYILQIGRDGTCTIFLDEPTDRHILFNLLTSSVRKGWDQGSVGNNLYWDSVETIEAKTKNTDNGRSYTITGTSKLGVKFMHQINCSADSIQVSSVLEAKNLPETSNYTCSVMSPYINKELLLPDKLEFKAYTVDGKEFKGRVGGEPFYSWSSAIEGAQKLVLENVAGRQVSLEFPGHKKTYFRSESPEDLGGTNTAAFFLVRGEPITDAFVNGSVANFNILVKIKKIAGQ